MTMMNKKVEGTYAVDYIEEKIYVSKKFLKAASVVGTGAFEVMMVLKQSCPNFSIEIKEIAKIPDLELEDFLYEVLDNNIKVPIASLDNNYNHTTKNVDVLSLVSEFTSSIIFSKARVKFTL